MKKSIIITIATLLIICSLFTFVACNSATMYPWLENIKAEDLQYIRYTVGSYNAIPGCLMTSYYVTDKDEIARLIEEWKSVTFTTAIDNMAGGRDYEYAFKLSDGQEKLIKIHVYYNSVNGITYKLSSMPKIDKYEYVTHHFNHSFARVYENDEFVAQYTDLLEGIEFVEIDANDILSTLSNISLNDIGVKIYDARHFVQDFIDEVRYYEIVSEKDFGMLFE